MVLRAAWLVLGSALLCGCGQAGPAGMVPVSGVVRLDGKPLAGAAIEFIPTGTTKGTGSRAVTDTEGKYTLQGNHGGEGALPGTYKVIITKFVAKDGSDLPSDAMDPNARPLLPETMSDPDKTKLTAKVPEGGGPIDFPLTLKK